MNLFELRTENKILGILHKLLLVTGAIAIAYIIVQLFDNFINTRKLSSRK